MYLNELDAGRDVTLVATVNEKSIGFQTSIVEIEDERLLAVARALAKKRNFHKFTFVRTVYTKNRKVVNFSSPGVSCRLAFLDCGKVQVINGVKVLRVRIPASMTIPLSKDSNKYLRSVLILFSDNKSGGNNRRESYRLPLGLDGKVRIGRNDEPEFVRIKDISAMGLGFLLSGEGECKIGDPMRISFSDMLPDKRWGEHRISFDVDAVVVRIEDAGDQKHKLVGCKMRPSDELNQYIYKKQMLFMNRGRMPRPQLKKRGKGMARHT